MDSSVNYSKVGFFVVTATALLIVALFWLGKFVTKEDFDRYTVYMKESVSGLNTDATVKYRGVNVGSVEKIEISDKNSEEIKLILRLKKDLPIKTDAQATLKSIGFTGLSFIEITGGQKNSPKLLSKNGELPVIPSSPSTLARADESLTEISVKVVRTLDKIDRLLDDKNLLNTQKTLENLALATQTANTQLKTLSLMAKSADNLSRESVDALKNITKTAQHTTALVQNANEKLKNGEWDMKSTLNDASLQMKRTVDELLYTNAVIREGAAEIFDSPSDIFFKKSPQIAGPGE